MGVREKREERAAERERKRQLLIDNQILAAMETECDLCITAATKGWWGDSRVTHCRDCHATWNRESNVSHCSSCHNTFSGPSSFTEHRKHGECLDPAGVGLEQKVNKHGTVVWKYPGPDKTISSWSGNDDT